MPGHLRTRLRRVLTGSQEEGGSFIKVKGSKGGKPTSPESDFYQPGEQMPPLKYRRPVEPEHKACLEAFSFQTAWRRRSHASLYSPMASRAPSCKGSFRSRRSKSIHRSRASSFSSNYDHQEWVDSGIGASIAGDERPANIKEASDDEGDVLNVGLSRNPTQDPRDAIRPLSAQIPSPSGQTSQPFLPEELELALAKTSINSTIDDDEATEDEDFEPSDQTKIPHEDYDDDQSPFLRPRGGSIYVPYNGHGTPPKLPLWGTAFPSCNDTPSAGHFSRRASIFINDDGASTPEHDRHESVIFIPSDAPGLTAARRVSIFVPAEEPPCKCPPLEPSKHQLPPCAPCDAIAAILARPDYI